MFEPIAIIGRACVLPGALTPAQLWQNAINNVDSLTEATNQDWCVNVKQILAGANDSSLDKTWSARCGRVQGFQAVFSANDFALPADFISQQAILTQWLLHTGREALRDANYSLEKMASLKAGAVIGNLSYPTEELSFLAGSVWLNNQDAAIVKQIKQQPLLQQSASHHRFMSGYPVQLLAKALNLTEDVFAIDAACASSLYAIKLACDYLQDGRADIMLAGGINGVDSLFLNMGFTALQALSKTGQSLPLHRQADGLIPSQGAAIVTLKRLHDAITAGDSILGVIRGIGLTNDGSSKGFLAPTSVHQIRAMERAYQLANYDPTDISWVECHATGTLLGDATEIQSMQQIFSNKKDKLSVGALKANIGHSITASGAAALIKVLSAFKEKTKTPTRLASENPAEILASSSFKLLKDAEHWEINSKHAVRSAAINAFGFGGNNAHLIVEEWVPAYHKKLISKPKAKQNQADTIAIVGIGIVAASANNRQQFTEALFKGESLIKEYAPGQLGGYLEALELPIKDMRIAPSDLEKSLGQQLAILQASREALAEVNNNDPENTSVFIGMQCDAEIARFGLRWRLGHLLTDYKTQWLQQAQEAICPSLTSASTLGVMPNIVANRLNYLFNFKAPSFTVSSEELSGIHALKLGIHGLQNKEIDTAVVGAVDLACETVNRLAVAQMTQDTTYLPGDAAVVLILKRLEDAQAQHNIIYAVIPNLININKANEINLNDYEDSINKTFGQSHAAKGLLQVAAAALACHEQLLPVMEGVSVPGTASLVKPRLAKITTQAIGGQQATVYLQEHNMASANDT